jgi:uncharacterized protein (TIGR02246 family)
MAIEPHATNWRDSAFSGDLHAVVPDQERAKDRIRAAYLQLAGAWTKGNADGIGALLADDCDHLTLGRTGQVRRGRAQLLDTWASAFARRGPSFSIRLTPSLRSIRLLAGGLALVDGDFEYSSGFGAEGRLQGRSSQPFAAVMTRGDDGEWLLLSIRVGAATRAAVIAES